MAAYTTIDDPEAYFQTQLYTGNGSANHAITLGADTDMQPDLVWIKNRDATDSHCLFDAVRGATKVIHADANSAEATDADTLDSFTSDGFQVDADVKVNTNAEKYVAWCWKESATAGFDIVTYTGTGSATTVSHSLSAVPKMIFVKQRDEVRSWLVYNKTITATSWVHLDRNDAASANVAAWNNTEPTSSVFSVGTYNDINKSDGEYVAYCFAEKQGFSKIGSYIGNGNNDGTFVYTGFRPAYVMVKKTNGTTNWQVIDNKRSDAGGFNIVDKVLSPNATDADYDEGSATWIGDILSNGFKWRGSGWGAVNASGDTYIYMAFAEAPFVNSNGVPCNAR